MKVLTKEEEDAHYNHVLKGGISGGVLGLSAGLGLAYALHHRYPFFRSLTLPFKAFFVTSTGTFTSIIAADRYSRNFQNSIHHPDGEYVDSSATARAEALANRTLSQKLMAYGRENRYTIVGLSWAASMGISLGLVAKDPYLTRAQKLVQARVYAQGLTLLVLIASAAFEVSDKRSPNPADVYKVLDPKDPEHKRVIEKRVHHETYAGEDLWMDIVKQEEEKMKAKEELKKKRIEEMEAADAAKRKKKDADS